MSHDRKWSWNKADMVSDRSDWLQGNAIFKGEGTNKGYTVRVLWEPFRVSPVQRLRTLLAHVRYDQSGIVSIL